jgi:hypothetical protein
MAERSSEQSTDARDATGTVRAFIRAVHRGDAEGAGACCTPDAEFSMEQGNSVPVLTRGARTFAELYGARPGASYWITGLRLHAAPGGVVAVWRVAWFGRSPRRFLGVSVFQMEDQRIRAMETTYVPVPTTDDVSA